MVAACVVLAVVVIADPARLAEVARGGVVG